MQIFTFRNDARVTHHPSYQESQLATLDALHEKFTALAADESLDAKCREHSREVLGRVDQSISGLRRSAA